MKYRYFCNELEKTTRVVRESKSKSTIPGLHKLYTEKRRFLCEPSANPPNLSKLDSSILYPKCYVWTKPDAILPETEKIHKNNKVIKRIDNISKHKRTVPVGSKVTLPFLSEDTSSDSDSTLSNYSDTETESEFEDIQEDKQNMSTHSSLTPEMQLLLNTDCSDIIDEPKIKDQLTYYDKKEHVDIKPLKVLHTNSELSHFPSRLSSLKNKLRSVNKRKVQCVDGIYSLLDSLDLLKKEYLYYDNVSDDLASEIQARETLYATSSVKTIPKDVSKKLENISKKLIATENSSLDIKKELTVHHDFVKSEQSKDTDTPQLAQSDDMKPEIKEEITDSPGYKDLKYEPPSKRIRKSEPKHKCAVCGKTYETMDSFNDHVKAHSEPPRECNLCKDRFFSNMKAYDNHMKFHSKGEVYHVCTVCTKKFEVKSRLNTHMNVHKEPSLKCRVHSNCTSIFTFEGERKKHETYVGQPKRFQCKTCEQLFTLPKTIRKHQTLFAHAGITQLW